MKSIISQKINPIRDWKIITYIFAIGLVLISLIFWKIYLSKQIGGGYFNVEVAPVDNIVKTIDKNRLQTDLIILENRQTNFLKIKNSPTKIIDPSL